jgi:hypothetical protein
MERKVLAALAVLGVLVFSAPGRADAIDGDWCHTPDNRRLSIRGPDIVTPGGKNMQGNYSRHYFTYTVPLPEPHAGATVYMQLLDENTVHLRVGDAASATPETWFRCSPSTSTPWMLPRASAG